METDSWDLRRSSRGDQRTRELKANVPRAVTARYDRRTGRVVIELSSGLEVGFLPEKAEGLAGASAAELEEIEITPSDTGFIFRSWMRICICQRCCKGLPGAGSGWRRAREGWGSVAKPGESGGGEEEWKVGGRPRVRGGETSWAEIRQTNYS